MEVRSLGKTKRNCGQERARGHRLRRRGFARGSYAVYKVREEEGKAAPKKQIPSAPSGEKSPTEVRRSSITRNKRRGLSIICAHWWRQSGRNFTA